MKQILVATNNRGKLNEFIEMFKKQENINLNTFSDIGVDIDVLEDGETFEENAIKKARESFEVINAKMPVIAEDSGLLVDALNGAPGVYSKRYYEGKTDEEGNEMLLDELKNVKKEFRTAKYLVVMCYYDGVNLIIQEGECKGKIAFTQIGKEGFSYDYIFIPDENNSEEKTFGELGLEFKNKISHRKRAISKLILKLESDNIL